MKDECIGCSWFSQKLNKCFCFGICGNCSEKGEWEFPCIFEIARDMQNEKKD